MDFFMSYTGQDEPWAEWIAWELMTAGYEVGIQAWHFEPGGNVVEQIEEALQRSDRVVCVVSAAYLRSRPHRASNGRRSISLDTYSRSAGTTTSSSTRPKPATPAPGCRPVTPSRQ